MAREVGSQMLTERYIAARGNFFRLGEVVTDTEGNEYRWILFNAGDGAASATVGHLIMGLDTGGSYAFWEGTNDNNSSTIKVLLQRAFGFVQAALADGEYGFVQISGPNKQTVVTDGSVAQGEQIMAHATTTGAVDSHDDTAATTLGTALEADTGSTLPAGDMDIRIP